MGWGMKEKKRKNLNPNFDNHVIPWNVYFYLNNFEKDQWDLSFCGGSHVDFEANFM